MCNNNGACRKVDFDVMCPSYRVTRDEIHSTRGRANSLRLALSGQLGPDALVSDAMYETMRLCVGCKGCKRECPTGVDMARMKVEFLHHYRARHGLPLRERLFAYLPRYAAHPLAPLLNLGTVPGFARLSRAALGLTKRPLPRWRGDRFRAVEAQSAAAAGAEVALFADTFNAAFEPETLRAGVRVLRSLGYRVTVPVSVEGPGNRPLCCGRTFLAAGLVDEARAEARRSLAALAPLAARGVPILGLEPACLFTLKDEWVALVAGETDAVSEAATTVDAFLSEAAAAGRIALDGARFDDPGSGSGRSALVHGHCHEKAFAAFQPTLALLDRIKDLAPRAIESSCCGMAGSFGYEAENAPVSRAMAELSLLPALRDARPDDRIVANGFSCRRQIADLAGRKAVHAIELLAEALSPLPPGGRGVPEPCESRVGGGKNVVPPQSSGVRWRRSRRRGATGTRRRVACKRGGLI